MSDTSFLTPAFLASEFAPASFNEAFFHILPMPLEKSVSYGGGTAAGPAAIIKASHYLEAFDGRSVPGSLGIHTQAPIPCAGPTVEEALAALAREVERVVAKNAIPVVLGGEHTVTLGAIDGLLRKKGRNFGVVQFDAHADLRESYADNLLSHACVMRRIHERGIPFMQIGIRSLSQAEHEFRLHEGVKCLDALDLYRHGIPQQLLPPDFPAEVYITFDVDGFDPAFMPATGTPEPGGLGWYQTMELLELIATERKIIGFDVVELAPAAGLHSADFTAAKLVYCLMGIIERQRAGAGNAWA